MSQLSICLFCTQHVPWPWFRQTRHGDGYCAGVRFLINEDPHDEADWLVCFDAPLPGSVTRVPRERRILVVTEPPEVKPYTADFTQWFGTILSPFSIRSRAADNLKITGALLNWHYGVDTRSGTWYTDLGSLEMIRGLPVPEKKKRLSIICSTKTLTHAQRSRNDLVHVLERQFGRHIDLFGKGRNPVDDKALAIAPYKYHVVLENSRLPFFWTEKLSDTWIGYSLPIYLGAPNIHDHTPDPAGVMVLPEDNLTGCLDLIESLLVSDPYQALLPAIIACRNWCLDSTNVFLQVANFIKAAPESVQAIAPLNRPEKIPVQGRCRTAMMRLGYRSGLFSV